MIFLNGTHAERSVVALVAAHLLVSDPV